MNAISKLSLIFALSILTTTRLSAYENKDCEAGQSKICEETGSFEIYFRCLNEKQQLLKQCLNSMNSEVKEKQKAVLNSLDEKAAEVGLELDSETSELNSHLSDLNSINQKHKPRFDELQKRFFEFVQQFEKSMKPKINTFGASYVEAASNINALAVSNKEADIAVMASLAAEIENSYRSQINYLMSVRSRVVIAREEIRYFSEGYLSEAGSHQAYLASKGQNGLVFSTQQWFDLLINTEDSINKVIKDVNTQHSSLLSRIEITTTALKSQFVAQKSLKLADDTNHVFASANFLRVVNVEIEKAFVTTKDRSWQDVPLFAERYRAMTDFLEFSKICSKLESSTWTKTGCSFVKDKETAARNALSMMPSNIAIGLRIAQAKNASSISAILEIKELIKAGVNEQAVAKYDALIKQVFQ